MHPSPVLRARPWICSVVLTLGSSGLVGAPGSREAQANVDPLADAPVHLVYLDPGSLRDRTTGRVRVARGDTLSEIALAHLGSVKRAGEIQRLNPEVDVRALKVGQTLRLPPRAADGASGWVDLLVALPGGTVQPILEDQPATLPLGPVRLFAVPHEHLRALRRSAGPRGPVETALFGDPKVAHSELFEVQAAEGRPLARAITHLVVTGLSGRQLEVALREQQLLSATGHRVPPASSDGERGGLLTPVLLALGGMLVLALIWLAARRLNGHEAPGRAPDAP